MNLYEFQAKELISRFGIEIPRGRVAGTAEDTERLARRLGFPRFVIKAQIHGGARGQAGGVRFATSAEEARSIAGQLLSRALVTSQTRPGGEKVRWLYVEEALEIVQEIYVAVVLSRSTSELELLVSGKGGGDIEETVLADASAMGRFPLIVTETGVTGDFAQAARETGLTGAMAEKAAQVFANMARVASELDATLVEINPLAVTRDQRLVALDAKLTVDGNALFRHPALSALRAQIEVEEGDPRALAADRHHINYQKMDGNVGVVCNGAGLSLATNDMLIDSGLKPANFLDIRTTASSLDISYGLGVVLENPMVRVLLINIHGGGMQRCDTVAEGLAVALSKARHKVPVVVRFAGNNADFARVRLKSSGVVFADARDMADATRLVLAALAQEAA